MHEMESFLFPIFFLLPNIPHDMRVYLLRDSENPRAIHASKAVGEPPLFLAMSVFLAIKASWIDVVK